MTKGLMGHHIELEVDPNPNGLPVLLVHFKYNERFKYSALLDETATQQLINELQEKLKEMK